MNIVFSNFFYVTLFWKTYNDNTSAVHVWQWQKESSMWNYFSYNYVMEILSDIYIISILR